MQKFNDKALTGMATAFFYSTVKAFIGRTAELQLSQERYPIMRAELLRLWGIFDDAYKRTLKSQLTNSVEKLDEQRDHFGTAILSVARIWAEQFKDVDETLAIRGRRVWQVFKDFNFRTREALVAENAKIENIEQRFAHSQLVEDLAAMGLTELNNRFASMTTQIEAIMSQRNEEQSYLVVGELKTSRDALYQQYCELITYLNAIQTLAPEESISLAAQFYNEDLRKIELQIAQSKRKSSSSSSSVTPKPTDNNGGGTSEQGGDTGEQGGGTGEQGGDTGEQGGDTGEQGGGTGEQGGGTDTGDTPPSGGGGFPGSEDVDNGGSGSGSGTDQGGGSDSGGNNYPPSGGGGFGG